jgi:hypothetical protein
MTLEETTTTPEAATQAEGEVGVETKIYICIACFMREI